MVGTTRLITPSNIVLGSYEGSIAGLKLSQQPSSALELSLNFGYTAHANAVRSCAISGPTLVTGGYDETIRVYSLSHRVEVGTLLQHDGTVNTLKFANDGRELLFSGADDAQICVWRCSDWTCLKRFSGHQEGILALDVHPSCRVALSTAKDRSLFMWDLERGKIVYSAKTKIRPATDIQWSQSGDRYMLRAGNLVSVSDVDGRSVKVFPHEKEVLCNTFLDENRIATGGEDKMIRIWDTRESTKDARSVYEHDIRIRGLSSVDGLIVSADGAGGVKIWDERMAAERLETCVADGKLRITCMAVAPVDRVVEPEKEQKEDERPENVEEKGDDEEADAEKKQTASQRKRKKRKNNS